MSRVTGTSEKGSRSLPSARRPTAVTGGGPARLRLSTLRQRAGSPVWARWRSKQDTNPSPIRAVQREPHSSAKSAEPGNFSPGNLSGSRRRCVHAGRLEGSQRMVRLPGGPRLLDEATLAAAPPPAPVGCRRNAGPRRVRHRAHEPPLRRTRARQPPLGRRARETPRRH